jgi:hypothetical protein
VILHQRLTLDWILSDAVENSWFVEVEFVTDMIKREKDREYEEIQRKNGCNISCYGEL